MSCAFGAHRADLVLDDIESSISGSLRMHTVMMAKDDVCPVHSRSYLNKIRFLHLT